jgi:hypothetical protein
MLNFSQASKSQIPKMNFELTYEHWKQVLTEDEHDFVQALLIMKTPSAAADMCGITKQKANKLAKSPRITTALDLAKRQLRQDTQFTPADVAEDLMLIRDMSLGRIPIAQTTFDKEGNPSTHYVRQTNLQSAQKAVENLGRMLGVFTDKKEISIPASDAQILKKIEDILGVTVDGSSSEVLPEAPDLREKINDHYETLELGHIKSSTVDAMAEDLLSDPILKEAVREQMTPSKPYRPGAKL